MAAKGSDILWQLEGVSFGYTGKPVLDELNMVVEAGCCHGILGPNGSGKTTLLDLLCGLIAPEKGSIVFAGQSLSHWHGRQLARRLALVPQDFTVRFGFSVREVVEMGRHPHLPRFGSLGRADHLLVDEVMEELDIVSLGKRSVTQLSGGEKQRVAVARALAQNPEVLVLDEATSNLDIYHSLAILEAIRRRVRSGKLTVVAALHDLNLAGFFCDRLIFLRGGELVYTGSVEEALNAALIHKVYGVEARVRQDDFSGCKQVSYRLSGG
ncbi:MAG: ABC transporter ATP-binding protein [Desulfobulbus sp.]|nr:MAG: ABC transporter ATP-binding protein [Desulfobulbus sp.]